MSTCERYKLSPDGIIARDCLLIVLNFDPGGRIATAVSKVVKLCRQTTTTWLLCNSRSVAYKELRLFFIGLLTEVGDKYSKEVGSSKISGWTAIKLRNEIKNKYPKLKEEFQEYIALYLEKNTGINLWKVPAGLFLIDTDKNSKKNYSKKIRLPKADQSISTSRIKINVSSLANVLWHLDYTNQEDEFDIILNGKKQCMAFSLSADFETLQCWLLNRLFRKIVFKKEKVLREYQKLQRYTFNIEKDDIRDNYQEFVEQLSISIASKPNSQAIRQEIHSLDTEKTIVLVITGFRKFKAFQESFFREFWEPLNNELSESSDRPKIIVFFVDERHISCSCNEVVKLKHLSEINEYDINKWVGNYRSYQYFPDNLMAGDFSHREWRWNDPWLIIKNIGLEFGLTHGIDELDELWKMQYKTMNFE